jgi:NTP pyrophosphatase (non-canonical NTP hydrolase)
MTYTEFVKSVESTSWHQPDPRLLHAAMGLVTESAEILTSESDEHTVEELGDVMWYVALGLDALGQQFEEVPLLSEDDFLNLVPGEAAPDSLVIVAADILDLVKKSVFYGRVIDHEKIVSLFYLMKNIAHYGLIMSPNFEDNPVILDDVIEANVKKLRARFPEKFSEDAANNRDVKAEYAAMSR